MAEPTYQREADTLKKRFAELFLSILLVLSMITVAAASEGNAPQGGAGSGSQAPGSDTGTPASDSTAPPAGNPAGQPGGQEDGQGDSEADTEEDAEEEIEEDTEEESEEESEEDSEGGAPDGAGRPEGRPDGAPDGAGRPEGAQPPMEPGAKAKEVLAGLMESLADQLPENARAVEALATSLQAITDGLIASGAAQNEEEAEALVEAALEEKRSQGQAARGELDLLAHVQQKRGNLAGAEQTLKDRVAMAPRDLSGYLALGQVQAQAGTDAGIEAYVGGQEVPFDVRPQVIDGRTLVPVRAITEALGANVAWDAATQTVTITAGGQEIQLVLNSRTVTINGQTYTLDVPASVIDGRTVVPLRFVAEALGLDVQWLAETQTIVINE